MTPQVGTRPPFFYKSVMPSVRTYLDRYPAKMVTRLADKLAEKYLDDCSNLLDPFCGSGAILMAGKNRDIPVTGLDLNPYAILLSRVKLEGFDPILASEVCSTLTEAAARTTRSLPISWSAKHYWFTEATVSKYEKLRGIGLTMGLCNTREGRAVLLAFALSVRRCSKADQRSPKPFISKQAIKTRKGKHFDPSLEISHLLKKLSVLYGLPTLRPGRALCLDLTSSPTLRGLKGRFSHVITSPPYINAQDYFRNFKLELYLLEMLLPFQVAGIKSRFLGTERGSLIDGLDVNDLAYHATLVPQLRKMGRSHPRHSAVVHRFLADTRRAFALIKLCLRENGKLVVVCGDNLVGGYRIVTWKVLNRILEDLGFSLFDSFGDTIDRRNVPPRRSGHAGLIKQEVISAFRLNPKRNLSV